jgi:hypothetical protein
LLALEALELEDTVFMILGEDVLWPANAGMHSKTAINNWQISCLRPKSIIASSL